MQRRQLYEAASSMLQQLQQGLRWGGESQGAQMEVEAQLGAAWVAAIHGPNNSWELAPRAVGVPHGVPTWGSLHGGPTWGPGSVCQSSISSAASSIIGCTMPRVKHSSFEYVGVACWVASNHPCKWRVCGWRAGGQVEMWWAGGDVVGRWGCGGQVGMWWAEDDLVAIGMALLDSTTASGAALQRTCSLRPATAMSSYGTALSTSGSATTQRPWSAELALSSRAHCCAAELAQAAICCLSSQSCVSSAPCCSRHQRGVNTAVLAASVDWEPNCSVAQTVRATPCFYNRPWFDNVALNTESESFAQLCLLFTAGDMKLAMVRSYQELPPREQAAQVLSKHGNTRLRWAQQGQS
ncbi:hypothetical protein HaLaN_27468 [Haematococcus lacustris]|uniref:Uncharacterized protein n=1 Tax=Haematococcus lacustris TaxID=44745 RepID=A0A6A0A8Y1_HAELA|nr:hypothetical protein HaLaN_27468 [Haematococcus lacustris]